MRLHYTLEFSSYKIHVFICVIDFFHLILSFGKDNKKYNK